MELTGAPAALLNFAVIAFGLCVGSFLNVAIYRLPREGLSPTKPARSFCPACKSPIAWFDNIPVISWLALGGRCRGCQAKIPFRYPLVELITGLLSILIFLNEGLGIRYAAYFYFACCLVAISFIDLELMVIPNILVWTAQAVALIVAAASPYPPLAGRHLWTYLDQAGLPDPLISLIGCVLSGLAGFLFLFLMGWAYKKIKGHKGLGEGDPPLLGMISMFLGLQSIIPTLFMSSVLGLAAVILLIATGRLHKASLKSSPIPFGPFLALGALVYLFFGPALMEWYLAPLSG